MKKLLMMFLGLVVFSSTVLADDDKPISIAQMPKQAQQFIAEYFPGIQVSFATQEGKAARSYDVVFTNGNKVEFDRNGAWTNVECKHSSVPDGIIPAPIAGYVKKHFPETKIVQIEKEDKRYEVELSNSVDLTFNKSFKLLEVDL